MNTEQNTIWFSSAETNYPSPFTCVGPGYKGMIKPELVEEGGNIIIAPSDPSKLEDIGGKLMVLNPKWIEDGKLFSADCGTSFSAPKVAHYIAKLFNYFPNYSSNTIKTLLISSAKIPLDRPTLLKEITLNDSDTKLIDLHPGIRLRKKGIHQKGIKVYLNPPDIDPEKPLVLAILSQSKWLKDSKYNQESG